MLPIVISPTNSRLGHLLMTCSTAAAVSAGGTPCLPAKKQGDLCQALPETSPHSPQLREMLKSASNPSCSGCFCQVSRKNLRIIRKSHLLSSPLVFTCTMTFSL